MRRRQPIAVAGDPFGETRMSKVSSCAARGKNRTSGWIDQSADLGAKVRGQMRDEARRAIPRSLLSVDSHPGANVTIEWRCGPATSVHAERAAPPEETG